MPFQARLTTKLTSYSVDDATLELHNNVDKEQLNHILVKLLVSAEKFTEQELKDKNFDFLVGGRLLQLSVEKHLELYSDEIDTKEILNEKLVEIEYLLSLEAPKPQGALPHDDWVSCVDANETHILSGSYDNSIRIFSIKDKKSLLVIPDAHEKPVTKVRWLRNFGNAKKNELYFVSSGHDQVSILRRFNVQTHKHDIVFVYKGHNRSVNCLDAVDDVLATGSFDKTLRLWSTNLSNNGDENQEDDESKINSKKRQKVNINGKSAGKTSRAAIMTLTGHQESVTGVRWLGSLNDFQSLATCSMDQTICIWDVEVGECKRRMLSAKPLLGIDFCAEKNLILSASCDRHIRVWDARAPDHATAKTAYTSHNAWVSAVAFGKGSNNFVSSGYDNLVKLWDLRSSKACLFDMIGHHDKVLDVNWTNSSYVLSGSADSTLKVFSTKE